MTTLNCSETRQLAFVVDDSGVVRSVAAGFLRRLGFRVSCHVDGMEALAHCRQEMPDFILLDWHMPRMDGLTFLRHIRAEHHVFIPRIALCTTENHPREIAEALQAGADEFIMKPFDEGILRLKLEQMNFPLQVIA